MDAFVEHFNTDLVIMYNAIFTPFLSNLKQISSYDPIPVKHSSLFVVDYTNSTHQAVKLR